MRLYHLHEAIRSEVPVKVWSQWGQHVVPILHDPSPSDAVRFYRTHNKDLRGLQDEQTGHFYLWPAGLGIHVDVAHALGVKTDTSYNRQEGPQWSDWTGGEEGMLRDIKSWVSTPSLRESEYDGLSDEDEFDDGREILTTFDFQTPEGLNVRAVIVGDHDETGYGETLEFHVGGVDVGDGPIYPALARHCYEYMVRTGYNLRPVSGRMGDDHAAAVFDILDRLL